MSSSRLRVLLNDRVLWRPATGISHYIQELLRELPAQDAAIELVPFGRAMTGRWRGRAEAGDAVAERRLPHSGAAARTELRGRSRRRPPDWVRSAMLGAYAVGFRLAGRWGRFALYHEPNHIPVPWSGPVLTTVHDLSAIRHPEWHPTDRVRWYERELLAGVKRTTHFVTVSKFTRDEMMSLLGIAAERISVVPLAARRVFRPRAAADVAAFLAAEGWPRDYLLFVGTLEPRKNLRRVLEAYADVPASVRDQFPLLVVGGIGWGEEDPADLVRRRGLAGHVRFAGYVDDATLAWLYAGARALVWPSLYEGFGLPPLECMACGTPVIASTAGAVAEVVGDAALCVDPLDVDQIRDALCRALEDDAFCRDLAERGLARSGCFSWSRCAAEHARLYRQVAASVS